MKGISFKLRSLGIASLVLFSSLVFAGQAVAEGYLGEFCWKMTFPNEPGYYAIGKFAVTEVGTGHYTLNGKFTSYENNALQGSILQATGVGHGNAELVGSTIVVTTTHTSYDEDDGDYKFGVDRWHLDPSTLSGIIRLIEYEYESPEEFVSDYHEGSIEFLPSCE